jgi:hypothetical protein
LFCKNDKAAGAEYGTQSCEAPQERSRTGLQSDINLIRQRLRDALKAAQGETPTSAA